MYNENRYGTYVKERTISQGRKCQSKATHWSSMNDEETLIPQGKLQIYVCLVVDGGWNDWTAWTSCTKTCGGGEQERVRACNNPTPVNGGADCSGKNTMTQPCNWNDCPGKYYYI